MSKGGWRAQIGYPQGTLQGEASGEDLAVNGAYDTVGKWSPIEGGHAAMDLVLSFWDIEGNLLLLLLPPNFNYNLSSPIQEIEDLSVYLVHFPP